jgi:hypothetical protein
MTTETQAISVPDQTEPQLRRRSSRIAIIGAMILSLLASAGARYWSDQQREAAVPSHGGDTAAASLGSMNSFALGLLLGGLRGPLVMILWTESETQKSEKNLEGVDTQIEWIRLLQPEFDTVHIFEIWNKAYNISVQMASLANKYDVILGALDYAYKVDRAKPDDINIVAAIGQLYFDKLGTSAEKYYYRKRVREETLPHADNQKLRQEDPGWHRVKLDPILDASSNVLPELTRPAVGQAKPANLPPGQEWDDGSALQYLPQFAPYPDGVSTFGIAYNYYKRAQVLQSVGKQRHDQLSDLVIDSRPALSLKFWGEDELEWGHRRELQALVTGPAVDPFEVPMPENMDEILTDTAGFSLQHPVKDPRALSLAIDADARATKLLNDSLNEYVRHILNFPDREQQYQSYILEIKTELQLATGDYEYLSAMNCPPAERSQHIKNALQAYRECGHFSYINLLRYYIDSPLVRPLLPPGYRIERTAGQKSLEDLTAEQARDIAVQADELKRHSRNQYIDTDRYEFDRFIFRSAMREKTLLALPAAAATQP